MSVLTEIPLGDPRCDPSIEPGVPSWDVVPLVAVSRNGVIESVHHGAIAPNGMLHTTGGFLSANVDFDPGPGSFLDTAVFIDGFATRMNTDDGLW